MLLKALAAADTLEHAGGKAASQHVLLPTAEARGTDMAVLHGSKACANSWWAAGECRQA